MKVFKKKEEDLQDNPVGWLDESLEDDAVDLEEWAFWQGYYEEEEIKI